MPAKKKVRKPAMIAYEMPVIEPAAYEAPAKTERLNARITPAAKSTLERASNLEGRSMTDFIVEKALEAAIKTIAEHEHVVLGEQERIAFFQALLTPPTPSQEAKEAAKRYKQAFLGG